MKRNLIKGLLPVTLTAFLVAGCGTAANNASTTEATTQETTEKETSEEESSAANDVDSGECEVTMLSDTAVQLHKSDYFHRNMHRMPHTHSARS